jgi:hypothetical protein
VTETRTEPVLAPTETDTAPAGTPRTTPGDGDHERFAHYVLKDRIVESVVTGTPVVALCGKVWVPSRDPARFPVCPECKRLLELGPDGRLDEWLTRPDG